MRLLREDQKTFFSNMGRIRVGLRQVREGPILQIPGSADHNRKLEFPVSIREIIDQVEASKAKRLVVDSLSVLNQAYRNPGEARILLHTILGEDYSIPGRDGSADSGSPGVREGSRHGGVRHGWYHHVGARVEAQSVDAEL